MYHFLSICCSQLQSLYKKDTFAIVLAYEILLSVKVLHHNYCTWAAPYAPIYSACAMSLLVYWDGFYHHSESHIHGWYLNDGVVNPMDYSVIEDSNRYWSTWTWKQKMISEICLTHNNNLILLSQE